MLADIMEIKFRMREYSQVFNRVDTGWRIDRVVDQCVSFSWEGYNFSFTDIEFHIVSNAPASYRINIRLEYISLYVS
jgi:hypothetical protein